MLPDLTCLSPGPDAPRVVTAVIEVEQSGADKSVETFGWRPRTEPYTYIERGIANAPK